MGEPEVRGPGDALSADEETVLLAAAQGASLAPIGRWEGPVASLHRRGLLQRLDQFNYVVTPRGKAIADGKDDEFIKGLIADNNAAAALRFAGGGGAPGPNMALGRSTDEVDDVTAPQGERWTTREERRVVTLAERICSAFYDHPGMSMDKAFRMAKEWLHRLDSVS